MPPRHACRALETDRYARRTDCVSSSIRPYGAYVQDSTYSTYVIALHHANRLSVSATVMHVRFRSPPTSPPPPPPQRPTVRGVLVVGWWLPSLVMGQHERPQHQPTPGGGCRGPGGGRRSLSHGCTAVRGRPDGRASHRGAPFALSLALQARHAWRAVIFILFFCTRPVCSVV